MLPALLLLPALALLSAAIVRGMISARLMDVPDAGRPGARKSHDRPVPKGGGVGVVAAFAAGVAVSGLPVPFPAAVAAAVGIAVVAFLDDVRSWSFTVKLGAQVAGAAVVVASGLVVRRVGVPGFGVELGWLAVPFTMAWLVYVTNAMNFIDGLNGLAAGSSLLAGVGLVALSPGLPASGGALLASGLAGFLPFNYPRARIFMADVGSQFCGFVLGALAVADPGFLAVPLMLFGILYDVAFTLVRRLIAGERLAQAHRGHLYQVAQRSRVPAVWIAPLHWAFVCWGAACAAWAASWPAAALLVAPPQLAWTAYVAARARRHRLGRW